MVAIVEIVIASLIESTGTTRHRARLIEPTAIQSDRPENSKSSFRITLTSLSHKISQIDHLIAQTFPLSVSTLLFMNPHSFLSATFFLPSILLQFFSNPRGSQDRGKTDAFMLIKFYVSISCCQLPSVISSDV